ncbi:MAG TPA: alpha/beta family hydrolase [Thermodesulfobacteriota bacterium]|nr:alpha/beta family hydrolase [Thermodesulfobacteriota bacterium]
MKAKKVEIPCGSLNLEGILAVPDSGGPFSLVVVCHPHPRYGGNMSNNVVHAVCEKLEEKGMASLKFNFRGVGQSDGKFAGGIGEKEDLRAAISFAAGQPGIEGQRIGICGYSFGAMVVLSFAAENPVKAAAGISPIIQPENLLDNCTVPKLLVCGDRDEFVEIRKLEEIFRKIPEPKELGIYPGADHFWGGEEDFMGERVSEFFQRYLN